MDILQRLLCTSLIERCYSVCDHDFMYYESVIIFWYIHVAEEIFFQPKMLSNLGIAFYEFP